MTGLKQTALQKLESIFSKTIIDENDCNIWQGPFFLSANKKLKYPLIHHHMKTHRGNRLVYTLVYGEIPKGMFVCHKCDVSLCLNPTHLFLGTPSDNQRDAVQKGRHARSGRTHCLRGHPYSGDNLFTYRGIRQCRICRKAQKKRFAEKHKEKIREYKKQYRARKKSLSLDESGKENKYAQ